MGDRRDLGPRAGGRENWSSLGNLRVSGDDERSASAAAAAAASPAISGFGAAAGASVRPARVNKTSLSFILDEQTAFLSSDGDEDEAEAEADGSGSGKRITRSRSTGDLLSTAKSASKMTMGNLLGLPTASSRRGSAKVPSEGRKRRPPSRICKHEGCEQYVVDQGLCVRHGGGKRCQTEGCTSRAKHQGKCWRHGGSTECKVPNCVNRAKSRGFCWSHGGGTKCKAPTCEKIAISNGLCWAHGGGKRCIVKNCMRQAYERTNNLCNSHFQEWQQGVRDMEIDDDDDVELPDDMEETKTHEIHL